MATYEIDIPGKGTFRVESQGEMSEAQAYRAAVGQADMLKMADPTKGMSGTEKFLAGAGKALTDLGRGAKQIIPGFDKKAVQADVDESRKLDAPLMGTGSGQVGNFVGNVVPAIATMRIPGINTYTGAALSGGAFGALQPVSGNESRALNTLGGGAAGLIGQGLGNLISRAIRPVRSTLPAAEQALAEEASRRNIPLTAAQLTGSRPLQITESVMENLPFTSGPQIAKRTAQQQAFNRAVGATFGSAEDAITPEVAGAARTRIGQKFTDLAARNTLQADDALLSDLARIDENARRYLTPDVGRVVLNRMDDVLARVENGTMNGTAYRNLDSELGKAARGTQSGDLRNALGDLRGSLRNAMDRSISGADQAAWKDARREYANLMTVAPVAAKNEAGDVSGKTLLAAANAANKNAKFGAPSELGTLGRIGRAFVADQIPNSGTAQRALIQNLITRPAAGSVLGAGGFAATGNDPLKGAAVGAGVTAGGLLTPRAIQLLMNSPAGQRYLTQGLLSISTDQAAAINALARSGVTAGLLGYTPQQ